MEAHERRGQVEILKVGVESALQNFYAEYTEDSSAALIHFEQSCPEVTPELMEAFGFTVLQADINGNKTIEFKKEGLYAVTHRFLVVRSIDGKELLLKHHVLWNADSTRIPSNKFDAVQVLSAIQKAEQAYKVALLIQYPVPETRKMQFNGKPVEASEYFEGARDWSGKDPFIKLEDAGIQVSNPEALWTKALYNFVVGSVGDHAQGIVRRSDNRYYSQDVYANNETWVPDDYDRRWLQEIAVELDYYDPNIKRPVEYKYGHVPENWTPAVESALIHFANQCSMATRQDCEDVFYNSVGGSHTIAVNAEQLFRRMQVVPKILHELKCIKEQGVSALV